MLRHALLADATERVPPGKIDIVSDDEVW